MTNRWTAAAALVLLAACAPTGAVTDVDVPRGDVVVGTVAYRAETRVLESFPVQLRTVVTMTNTGAAPAVVRFPDSCEVLLKAYGDADRTGEPVWNQAAALMCAAVVKRVELGPGESVELTSPRTDASEVLGGGRLPDGTYWLTAVVRPDGSTVEIPAGSVQLAVPRGSGS